MSVSLNVITPQGLEPLQFPTKFRSPSLGTPGRFKKAYRQFVVYSTFYAAPAPVVVLTPLYVKTLLQAAWMIS